MGIDDITEEKPSIDDAGVSQVDMKETKANVSIDDVSSQDGNNTDTASVVQMEVTKPNDSMKLEDISSQDLDDSVVSTASESKPQEKKEFLEPKYSWKDRSNTSGEFELSLDINDQDFLDTVKNEYRSSSPSWANTKFTFPLKEDKIDKKSLESIPSLTEEESAERSVSVRKRMEDEMKKELDSKDDKEEIKEVLPTITRHVEKAPSPRISEGDKNEPVKIKSDNLKHKERQYRSSKEESSRAEEERERRKYEEEKYERKKRDERQRDRDRKERERNERIREDEERRRRKKMDEERKNLSRSRVITSSIRKDNIGAVKRNQVELKRREKGESMKRKSMKGRRGMRDSGIEIGKKEKGMKE